MNELLTEESLRARVEELGGDAFRMRLHVAQDLWFVALRLARAVPPGESDKTFWDQAGPVVFMGDVCADSGLPMGAWTIGIL